MTHGSPATRAPGRIGDSPMPTEPSRSASRERIKVLLLLTSTAGGAGQQNYFLAKRLSRARFDLTVAYGRGYPLDREFERMDLPVRHLSMSRKISPMVNLRGFFQIRRLIKQGRFDVVCTSCSIAGLMGRIAAALERVPTRIHVLHVYASRPHQNKAKQTVYRWIERSLDRITTRYVAVSEAAKMYGVNAGIMSADKVDVVFNAVEPASTSGRSNEETRRVLGLGEHTRVVGTLGRYEFQKGIRYILEAAPAVLAQQPDTQFLIVGDGPLRPQLVALASRLGIDHAVRFTGWRDDVPDVLRVMDVFCLASLWETFGLVLVEAMLAELPVVATRVDAVPEVVADEETGVLVPPGDPPALAGAILRLIEDGQEARRMGAAGLERARRRFSMDKMVAGYERVFSRRAEPGASARDEVSSEAWPSRTQ